jgi:hypothetical protein
MNDEARELISAWKKLDTTKPPILMKEDQEIMLDQDWFSPKEPELIAADEFFNTGKKFHLGLVPVPYAGKILTASIYVLMLNPGFSSLDLFAEEQHPEFRQRVIKGLSGRAPNQYIDPRFHWTGGFTYWYERLGKFAEEFHKDLGLPLRKVIKVFADHIATLELIPYHSARFNMPANQFRKLKSVQLIQGFAQGYVSDRARNKECSLIVARGAAHWDLDDSNPNIHVIRGGRTRRAYLSGEAGAMIRDRLHPLLKAEARKHRTK